MKRIKNYTGYLNNHLTLVEKSWGFERIFINTDLYCVKELNIKESCATSKHYHKKKHETFYLIQGVANITIFDINGKKKEVYTLKERETFCIEPNTIHSIENVSFDQTLILLESSTEDKPQDNIRINNYV